MDKSKDALGVLKHQAFKDLNSRSRTASKSISDKRLLQYKLYYKPHICPRASQVFQGAFNVFFRGLIEAGADRTANQIFTAFDSCPSQGFSVPGQSLRTWKRLTSYGALHELHCSLISTDCLISIL